MKSQRRKYIVLFILILNLNCIIFIFNVQANPIAPPRSRKDIHDLCVGPRFNETQEIKLQNANVTIECFNTESLGNGCYNITNMGNDTVLTPIYFMSGVQCEVEKITANGTEISYNITSLPYNITNYKLWNSSDDVIEIPGHISGDMDYDGDIFEFQEFILEFDPYSYIELYIQWRFTSGIIQSDFDQRIFHTGYSVNGGEYWGGLPIEWEHVRFNFHTDNFFTDNMTILVNIQNDPTLCRPFWASNNTNWLEMTETAEAVQIENDANGIPYYFFQAENFTESFSIHIINGIPTDTLSIRDDGIPGFISELIFAIILLGIAVITFKIRRKRRVI